MDAYARPVLPTPGCFKIWSHVWVVTMVCQHGSAAVGSALQWHCCWRMPIALARHWAKPSSMCSEECRSHCAVAVPSSCVSVQPTLLYGCAVPLLLPIPKLSSQGQSDLNSLETLCTIQKRWWLYEIIARQWPV